MSTVDTLPLHSACQLSVFEGRETWSLTTTVTVDLAPRFASRKPSHATEGRGVLARQMMEFEMNQVLLFGSIPDCHYLGRFSPNMMADSLTTAVVSFQDGVLMGSLPQHCQWTCTENWGITIMLSFFSTLLNSIQDLVWCGCLGQPHKLYPINLNHPFLS